MIHILRRKIKNFSLPVLWRKIQQIWIHDYWIVGKYFELTGGRFKVDGMAFFADSPAWDTQFKSGFLLHDYEPRERDAVKKYLNRDLPTIEFGAGFGVISCTTNRIMKSPSDHIVVEANPLLIPLLERNKLQNNSSFKIVEALYGKKDTFFLNDKNVGGSGATTETGKCVKAKTVTLKELIGDFEKVNLVSDIEGSELDLILNEMDVVKEHVDTVIIELHPKIFDSNIFIEAMLGAGFTQVSHEYDVYVFKK